MTYQEPWDRYEAAYLLKMYIQVRDGEISRPEAIAKTSRPLRRRAMARGVSVDDIFRNENGIRMQLSSMEYCYAGREGGLTISNLFREIVALYRNDRIAFEAILQEEYLCPERDGKGDSPYRKKVAGLLLERYPYGFRLGSPIEQMRFRSYAASSNIPLPESDEELTRVIVSAGFVFERKVFAFEESFLQDVVQLLNKAFASGVGAIFFTSLLEKNAEWLGRHNIHSEKLLKEVLRHHLPNYSFGRNFVANGTYFSEQEAIVSEVRRVCGDARTVQITEIAAQLTYIPPDKIGRCLSAREEFVWTGGETYFVMEHFTVNQEDRERILFYVAQSCETRGYASIANIPLGSIPEENFDLPPYALHTAVYSRLLKDRYQLNGKILTEGRKDVNLEAILTSYCASKEECSPVELSERAAVLTGSPNRQAALSVLYGNMVRVDTNRFVADARVSFDVDRIDRLLGEMMDGPFAPIKRFTTFALFPSCGYSWNSWLLESFCHRFSRQYRLRTLNFNDKNAGIIASAGLPLDYRGILCAAAAQAPVELTPERVGLYLFENGYTARSRYGWLPEVVEKARAIREGY